MTQDYCVICRRAALNAEKLSDGTPTVQLARRHTS